VQDKAIKHLLAQARRKKDPFREAVRFRFQGSFPPPLCWSKSLGLPNDEALSRSLHDSLGHLSQRVDFEDSFHFREETVRQPEVTARDADDRSDRLLVERG